MPQYASPYYDPVKAHEYYEEHKKLKGRHSTSGLNEKGKAAAEYAKKQFAEERDETIGEGQEKLEKETEQSNEQLSEDLDVSKKSFKATMAEHSAQMQSRIDRLNKKLKYMSAKDKRIRGDAIRNSIASLREANASKRAELQAQYSQDVAGLKGQHKSDVAGYKQEFKDTSDKAKQDYDTKLASELEKIRSDSSMLTTKKGKKSKSSSGRRFDYGSLTKIQRNNLINKR